MKKFTLKYLFWVAFYYGFNYTQAPISIKCIVAIGWGLTLVTLTLIVHHFRKPLLSLLKIIVNDTSTKN